MFSKEDEIRLDLVEDKICKIDDEKRVLSNSQFLLKEEYISLKQEKAKDNIGRCFKEFKNNKVIGYYKIINIDEVLYQNGFKDFNEYQYPSIYFKYPYDNSLMPFTEELLFSGAWGKGNDFVGDYHKITHDEISKEEFTKTFNEVNSKWIIKISE